MVHCELLREEFRVKKFGLSYDRPQDFYKPQFGSERIYLVCRILWMVFNLGWIIASGCLNYNYVLSEANRIKWFVFLTNWTYLLLTIHSIIMVAVVIYHQYFKHYEKEERSMPIYLKCIWILTNVVHGGSFIVTGTYWILLYPTMTETLTADSIVVHVFNSVYVLFNIFVSRIPIRILHCYQVMIYGLIYVIFTVIYQVSGGKGRWDEPSIYPMLNWDYPREASILAVVMFFLVSPLMHLLVYFLYRCRLLIADKCYSKSRLDYEESFHESTDQLELPENK